MKPRTRQKRVVARCKVEFRHVEQRVAAESEDLSERGVFVRTEHLLPVGAVVELDITLPDEVRFRVISRVAHLLSTTSARALGRSPGMGFEFLEQDNEGRERLAAYIDDLIEELTPPPQDLPAACRLLVADPSEPLRERLGNALGEAGFEVDAASNGSEAYKLCLDRDPDVLIANVQMPVVDGWMLIRMLVGNPRTARMPMVLMSDDSSDITRLQAYRLGVRDFIHKPFTDEEVVIRLRRLALEPRGADTVMLRGNLVEISVATLLSLMDFERKSGIVALLSDRHAARVFLAEGRVVRIEGPDGEQSALTRMMRVLDWRDGNFEFTSCEVVGTDELGWPTSQLLLEHARVHDEDRGR